MIYPRISQWQESVWTARIYRLSFVVLGMPY